MAQDVKNNYPWYEIKEKDCSISQGDIIDGLPVYFPSLENEKGESFAKERKFDVIVMTQSCDMSDFQNTDLVILCPRFPLTEPFEGKKIKDIWKPLVTGRTIHQHLINKCEIEGFEFSYQVVDLKFVITMQLSLLNLQVLGKKDRVCMLPPYREFMAQAFARQFMRIGLPNDFPEMYPG